MRLAASICSLILLIHGTCWAASVCNIIDHRLEYNGKEIEVTGTLAGGPYYGYFVCENEHCDPCVYRWIFSWPSAIFLAALPRPEDDYQLYARLNLDTGKPRRIVVKGRLRTEWGYYVINLPWRSQRPLGRFEWGGVAAALVVSDIKFLDKFSLLPWAE